MNTLTIIILAAGSSQRFKTDKTFIDLDGMPLFLHSVRTFLPMASQMLLVIPEGHQPAFREALTQWSIDCTRLTLVSGGATRTESVSNALRLLQATADSASLNQSDALIAIHDAARPFASTALLKRLCMAALACGGAVPGVPVANTLLRADADSIMSGSVPREHVWSVSTPQVFRARPLLDAYDAIGHGIFTDDAQVFSLHGGKVKIIQEDRFNIKITYPEDLELARCFTEYACGSADSEPCQRN